MDPETLRLLVAGSTGAELDAIRSVVRDIRSRQATVVVTTDPQRWRDEAGEEAAEIVLAVVDDAGDPTLAALLEGPGARAPDLPVVALLRTWDAVQHGRALAAGAFDALALEGLAPGPFAAALRRAAEWREGRLALERLAEREETLAALRRSHGLMEQLFGGVPDALFVKDTGGRYIMINEAGAALFGRTPAGALGLTDHDVFETEAADAIVRKDREVMRSGEVVTYEGPGLSEGNISRKYLITKGPLEGPEGEVVGVYGIARDVTAIHRTREALRASEAALRERVKELTTLLRVNGVLAEHHRPMDERLAEVVKQIPSGWHYPETTEARLLLPGREHATVGFEETAWILSRPVAVRGRDVGRLDVCLTEAPPSPEEPFLEEEATLLEAIVASVGEALERRNLEEQFLQAQKLEAIGRLAGGIAHDFNNLLTGIAGHAELLVAEIPEEHDLREDVEGIRDNVERAAGLTGQLLAFSRHGSQDPRPVDLVDAVDGFRHILSRVIGEDIRLDFELADEPVVARVDPSQLDQILLNLCVNSRDAMPGGGALRVAVSTLDVTRRRPVTSGSVAPGEWAVVEVADSGQGMEPETLERLFEPFFTTKEPGRGTGLGLSVVWGAVQQAGGLLDVESAAGEGTRFRVFFPRIEAEDGVEDDGEAEPEPGGGRHVVVVEDERTVRELLRRVMLRHGYRVTTMRNGREALEELRRMEEAPDLVLSDVVMPELGGVEMGRRMRAEGITVPLLFMTGYTEEEIPPAEELDGVVGLVQKPFGPTELLAEVASALESAGG